MDSFGDIPVDEQGKPVTQTVAIRQVVKEGALADQIALGEHHRADYAIFAPDIVLAAFSN